MADCTDFPTPEDAKRFKLDAETINEVVTLEQDRTPSASDGKTKKTMWGIENDATLQRENIDQLAEAQRDNIESTFTAQFAYKRIGNISGYVGQSLPEADKLNSYQYPDDSGEWYGPVQDQVFPITIPADPSSDNGWALVNAVTTDQSIGMHALQAANVDDMIAGVTVGGQTVQHEVGQVWVINGKWRVKSISAEMTIDDFDVDGSIFIDDFGADRSGSLDSYDGIARALDKLNGNQSLTSIGGNYSVSQSIVKSFGRSYDGSEINLKGNYIFTSQSGFDFKDKQQGMVKIGKVVYKTTDINDSDFALGFGVKLASFWNVECDITMTRNFLHGVELVGGDLAASGNGMAFNRIKIRNAQAPIVTGGIGCLVTTIPFGSNPGYYNGNEMHVGFLRGESGLVFQQGNLQTDKFNENKIYLQMELCEKIGMEIGFATLNTIKWPRFEGSGLPSDYWIHELDDCSRNDFYITTVEDVNTMLFEGIYTNIYGRLNGPAGGFAADISFGGSDNSDTTGNSNNLYLAHKRGEHTPNNTIYFGGLIGNDRWERYAGGVKDRSGVEKVFGLLDPYGQQDYIGLDGLQQVPSGTSYMRVSTTGSAQLTLQMSRDREINGYSMILDIPFFSQQLQIVKSSGSGGIASGVIDSTGLYLLVFRDGNWKASKIGNNT